MKIRLLIIISLIYATNLIKNAESVGERGQEPKLYKTFDEIFGKGWDNESNNSKGLNCRHVKEEVQDGQAPNTSDQKNIEAEILKQKFDEIYNENWSEDEANSARSADDYDQNNTKKHLFDQNNSTDQNESVDEQLNKSNKCEKIKSDQQKRKIIQKFRKMKENYREKTGAHSNKEWAQIEIKISNSLGVGRTKLYKWKKELGLSREKFSELEKREILKQFDEIKSKCKQAKLKSGSKNELDEKIARKLGVCGRTIYEWKREFGLSVSKKFSDATKIGILKKYAKIKEENPKMSDGDIADLLKVSISSLKKWKAQFNDENKHL